MLCTRCDDFPVSEARWKAGYRTCLVCGEREANRIAEQRKKQLGITYNKGAYQYITEQDLKTLGR